MEQEYLEEVKNKFVQDFRDGIYSEKKQEIWFKNELNLNRVALSNLLQFFSKVGYLILGVIITLIGVVVSPSIQMALNQKIFSAEDIPSVIIWALAVIMLLFGIILTDSTNKRKTKLGKERLMIIQIDSEIKKEIQRLTLLENNKSSKRKKRGN
jgi:sulfite exporter TauE/SafE